MDVRSLRIIWLVLLGAASQYVQVVDATLEDVTNWDIRCPSWAQEATCSTDHCRFHQGGTLLCRQVSNFSADYLRHCGPCIVNLEIIEGKFDTLEKSGLFQPNVTYPQLRKLSISNSDLRKVVKLPNNGTQLTELTFYNNSQLSVIYWPSITSASNLKSLNLSNNQLKYVADLSNMSSLTSLDLSGNMWDCEDDLEWALMLHERAILANGDSMLCHDHSNSNSSWFQWKYSVIKQQINKRIVRKECESKAKNCSCTFTSEGKEGRGTYTVRVDCSGRNMTSLPQRLPNFTRELDVSNNLLTSLDQVMQYADQSLRILIADSNQIQSVRNFSKSAFFRNFHRLSLRNNHINPSEIPLEDIVYVSHFHTKYIYLYNNSWECDCNMATQVREWLWKNRHIVNDSSLLLCSRNGRKIPVLYLLPSSACGSQEDPNQNQSEVTKEQTIYTLHVIICLETAAIVLLGMKLAYDSWHYFRNGELPWIATKLL